MTPTETPAERGVRATGVYQPLMWQIVTDHYGYETIHETDEDGGPGDLVAAGFGDHARLMVTAPVLLSALDELADVFAHDGENSLDRFERLAGMFRKDTGYLAPGKDQPMYGRDQPDGDQLRAIYDAWFAAKVTRARAALAQARGETA